MTSKARFFFKQEGLTGEPICLYCLAQTTGKRIGSTGLLEPDSTEITRKTVSTDPYRQETIQKSVAGCRPCAQRRRMFSG